MKLYRHIAVILLTSLGWTGVAAQDWQRLSEQELTGTARYVGMGGAMTAVGGDPSAVKDNPAGLGVYRRMEVMLSLEDRYDLTRQVGNNVIGDVNRFNSPQASWVFAWGNPYKDKGVIFNNVMFSYQNLRNYNREFHASAASQPQSTSLTEVLVMKTNGLQASDLEPADRWDNTEIGWLSCLGYDTYLIDPTVSDPTQWTSVVPQGSTVNNSLYIRESGYMNQYAFDWGMNISNKLYIGAGLRLQSFRFSRSVEYYEEFGNGGDVDNYSEVIMSGVGFNAALGVIYHPVQWFRLGASFSTPSATSVRISNNGEMSAVVRDTLRTAQTKLNSGPASGYHIPLRSSVGVAFQMQHYGLLSLQYDYTHGKDMNDVHSLRAGIEVVPVRSLYLNAGYVYESTFRKDATITALAYNSVRTDTDFQDRLRTQYISFGIGYRGRDVIAQVAYQFGMQRMDLYAHELANPYDMRTQTHRVVFTLGWHTR